MSLGYVYQIYSETNSVLYNWTPIRILPVLSMTMAQTNNWNRMRTNRVTNFTFTFKSWKSINSTCITRVRWPIHSWVEPALNSRSQMSVESVHNNFSVTKFYLVLKIWSYSVCEYQHFWSQDTRPHELSWSNILQVEIFIGSVFFLLGLFVWLKFLWVVKIQFYRKQNSVGWFPVQKVSKITSIQLSVNSSTVSKVMIVDCWNFGKSKRHAHHFWTLGMKELIQNLGNYYLNVRKWVL